MIFKNNKEGIVANIVDKNLIDIYKKDVNFVVVNELDFKQKNYELYYKTEIGKLEQQKIMLKTKLNKISEDIIQSQCGEIIPDLYEKKNQFVLLHNELRRLEGKPNREIKVDK